MDMDVEMEMGEQPYKLLYENPGFSGNRKCIYCFLTCANVLLTIILAVCLVILVLIGGAAMETTKCDHLITKVEKIEGKIYPLIDNVTQFLPLIDNITRLLNDTDIDMSAFAIVSRVVVKNRKQIEDIFPFLNHTKEFLQDSKKCIETYDICPQMRT